MNELKNRSAADAVGKASAGEPHQKLRARVLVVGMPLVAFVAILSIYADMVTRVIQFGVMQLAPPAVAVLFALAVLVAARRRWGENEWLSAADVLCIYSMLLVSVLISSRGLIEKLIPALAYLPYYATPENGLNSSIAQHLPGWAVPFVPSANAGPAPQVIRGFWEGGAANGSIPWGAWFGPMLAWFGLVGFIVLVLLCLATLLRRQWVDNEQLSFPLTTLPLAMIRDESEGESFFGNRWMWLGFALPTVVFGVNGLHANFPDWPQFNLVFGLNSLLSESPWNHMRELTAFFSFAALGIAYFLPVDLLFSLWFFFALMRLQDVGAAVVGAQPAIDTATGNTFWIGYQSAGAYLVLAAAQIRIGWPHYSQVARTAFGHSHSGRLNDCAELLSYRSAILGLVLGFAGIVLWLTVAGVNPWLAAAQMAIYLFVIMVVMSRGVCEAGILSTGSSFMPSHLINLVWPMSHWGASSLAVTGITDAGLMRNMQGMLLPSFMDSQKMAARLNVRPRLLLWPLAAAVATSFCVATAFMLYLHYNRGGLSLFAFPKWNAVDAYRRVAAAGAGNDLPRDSTVFGGLTVGMGMMTLLLWLRLQFAWFPLHPLGYAMSPNMSIYWFPFFSAWVLKSMILRFGGFDAYRRCIPFMLGIIAGEFMSGVIWAVMSMWRGWSAPALPWP